MDQKGLCKIQCVFLFCVDGGVHSTWHGLHGFVQNLGIHVIMALFGICSSMRCHGGLGLSLLLYFSVDQLTKRHADTQFIELAWPTNKRQFLLLNVCRSGSPFGNKQRKKKQMNTENQNQLYEPSMCTQTQHLTPAFHYSQCSYTEIDRE